MVGSDGGECFEIKEKRSCIAFDLTYTQQHHHHHQGIDLTLRRALKVSFSTNYCAANLSLDACAVVIRRLSINSRLFIYLLKSRDLSTGSRCMIYCEKNKTRVGNEIKKSSGDTCNCTTKGESLILKRVIKSSGVSVKSLVRYQVWPNFSSFGSRRLHFNWKK